MNPSTSEQGTNFSVAEIGAIDAWKSHTAQIKGLPGVDVPGKLFLNPILGLTGMEVSVNCLPAGAGVPFYHKHHSNEELSFRLMEKPLKFVRALSFAYRRTASEHGATTPRKISFIL